MKTFHLFDEKYYLRAIYGLLGLIFLVPLYTASSFYFPFITPRNFLFRILVELLVLAYVLLVLQNKSYLPQKHTIWKLLLVFIGLLTFSSLIGGHFAYSFWSTYERMEGLITLYHLVALFFVIYGVFKDRLKLEVLLQMSIFVSFIVSIIGLSQILGVNLLLASSGGVRITATLGNATYLAAYLLIHLFFVIYFLLRRDEHHSLKLFAFGFIIFDMLLVYLQIKYGLPADRNGIIEQLFSNGLLAALVVASQAIAISYFWLKQKQWYTQYAAPTLFTIMLATYGVVIANTETRGALVGLILAAVVACVLVMLRKQSTQRVRIGSGVVLGLIILSGVLTFVFKDSAFIQSQSILNKIASASLTDQTTESRIATWSAALQGIADKPVFGWGVENFHKVFNLYYPPVIYKDEGNPLWFDRPHNLLMQYAVEGGLLAIIVYAVLIIYIIRKLLETQKANYVGILFTAFFVAYLGQNLFVFDSVNSYIPFFVALAFIAHILSPRRNTEHVPVSPKRAWPAAMVIVIFTLVAIVGLNAQQITANKEFVAAYNAVNGLSKQKNVENPIENMFTVLDDSPELGKQEILGAFSEQVVRMLRSRALPSDQLRDIVNRLEMRFMTIIEAGSDDARFNMFLMNLYLNAAYLDKAYATKLLELSDQTIALSPTRTQLYYMTGRAHMILGEYDAGLVEFRKALELSPHVFAAQWNVFAGNVQKGDVDAAWEALELVHAEHTLRPDDYDNAARIFTAANRIDQAERVVRLGIERIPDSADLYVSLADILATQGKKSEARSAAEKSVELDPTLEEEAQEFLSTLE